MGCGVGSGEILWFNSRDRVYENLSERERRISQASSDSGEVALGIWTARSATGWSYSSGRLQPAKATRAGPRLGGPHDPSPSSPSHGYLGASAFGPAGQRGEDLSDVASRDIPLEAGRLVQKAAQEGRTIRIWRNG